MSSASSVSTVSTASSATNASAKSARRTRYRCFILATFTMLETATMTIAPSVASGSAANHCVKNSATTAVAAAATIPDIWLCAPARSLAADFERLEPMGKPWKNPAPTLAAPSPISS